MMHGCVPLFFLFLCRYHTVLITVALLYSLKSVSLISPASFFFLKIALTFSVSIFFPKILDYFCYHHSELFYLIDCLSPDHLVVLISFCLAPSSATYFLVISFCQTYCVCGLLSTDGRTIAPSGG